MDPDAVLAALRQAIWDWQTAVIQQNHQAQHEAAVRALTAASALDVWLSQGGFPPAAWPSVPPFNQEA